MTSDIKARLEEMVREKAKALAGHEAYMLNYNEALVVIALDLLQERDALKDKLAAAEVELEKADKGLLFWRGIPAYTLDMTYDEAMSSKAVEAAIARQKARAALKLGGNE